MQDRKVGVAVFRNEEGVIIRPKTGWQERGGYQRNAVTLTEDQAREALKLLKELLGEED